MELIDLNPKPVHFNQLGLDLTFKPFTIADDLRARDLCGGETGMVKAFEKFDFEKISLIAWYQLDLKSQRKILEKVEGVFIDPISGKETDAGLSPIDKFRNLFVGMNDQVSLVKNLVKCKGINIPDFKSDDEETKKQLDQLKRSLLTGP